MRRGFKADAEKAALEARNALNLKRYDRLDPWVLAKHLGIVVLDIHEIPLSKAARRQLLDVDQGSWSALTIRRPESVGIVLNQSHVVPRQRNDLMHEIAHIELRHVPVRVEVSGSGLLLLSSYSDEHEQEADWYAGALLLPRDALAAARRRGRSPAAIADYYGVSEELCAWRLRMTGVEIQMQRLHRGP